MIKHAWIQKSPMGELYLETTELGVSRLEFRVPDGAQDLGVDLMVAEELTAYFVDADAKFDLPVDLSGLPEFRRQVLETLQSIPKGSLMTYGEIAKKLGRPKGPRAVGQAVGSNPIAIIIPCHRVVASDGTLGGFSGGLDNKRWLLAHEGIKRPGGWVSRAEKQLVSA